MTGPLKRGQEENYMFPYIWDTQRTMYDASRVHCSVSAMVNFSVGRDKGGMFY